MNHDNSKKQRASGDFHPIKISDRTSKTWAQAQGLGFWKLKPEPEPFASRQEGPAFLGLARPSSARLRAWSWATTIARLAVGLKVSADWSQDDDPDIISVMVTLQRGTLVIWHCLVITITFCWCNFFCMENGPHDFSSLPGLITLTICLVMIMTVGFGFQQRNKIVVVPVATVFAFTQLRASMPGAPEGFDMLFSFDSVTSSHTSDPGDILDFLGVLPCLVLLSISAVTMVGIYLFTDPSKDSREKLTWPALVEALLCPRNTPVQRPGTRIALVIIDYLGCLQLEEFVVGKEARIIAQLVQLL
ncbi:hypothetical protein ARMGADRAFT_1034230 [Armillaria gallica]|uniref:Uncharacterized protein n=1 Tax=Armillaria gallica TaxID=47427 RepID=A0A2H3DA23_ARMGA|nr:hypothetical protein ARMGADRAFT_1034230 [Armillaria gallica]